METVSEIPLLRSRLSDAHKGDFGRILIVGGSGGMIGAPALAANAALRSGAGLVTIATAQSVQLTVASLAPCATSIPLKDTNGQIASAGVNKLTEIVVKEKRFDVIAVGPGLGQVNKIVDFLYAALSCDIPVIIDADGLNILAETDWQGRFTGRCIITPHPGELARLMKTDTSSVQSQREEIAIQCARLMSADEEQSQSICVLKGHNTVVTDGDRIYINKTGNPGMATGGSGDVLTGVIAGLLGQGLNCFDASVLGVYVHGLAGDIAAERLGQVSLTANDLIDYLPDAFIKSAALRAGENKNSHH